MKVIEHVDELGRKYKAYSDGGSDVLIIGPPESLVDELELPEPFATRLHNIMYERGFIVYADVAKANSNLMGALQEALSIDVQRLNEVFFRHEKEINHE